MSYQTYAWTISTLCSAAEQLRIQELNKRSHLLRVSMEHDSEWMIEERATELFSWAGRYRLSFVSLIEQELMK